MKRHLILDFDDFGWESLLQEARRQGVSVNELLVHASMYYLSDVDTGRFARRVLERAGIEPPPSPNPA